MVRKRAFSAHDNTLQAIGPGPRLTRRGPGLTSCAGASLMAPTDIGATMPDRQNIDAPITLVAHGRSGTSAIMQILGAHPDVEVCGETQALLSGVWHSAERLKGIVRPDQTLGEDADHAERCALAVRAAFLSMFPPTGSPRWMHKPIGIPWVFDAPGMRERPFPQRSAWYWDALARTFPRGTVLTVLRHPYDVVLSAEAYWGTPHAQTWRGLVRMARLLTHRDAPVGFAVSFRRLAADPAAEIARLLDHLALSPDAACFAAAGTVFVPDPGSRAAAKADLPGRVADGFGRRADWHRIDRSGFTDADRDALVRLFAAWDEPLDF